jgi:hypothetical protein
MVRSLLDQAQVAYDAVASLIAAESPEIAAVISNSALLPRKDASNAISRHYLHDSKTNFWVRALSLVVYTGRGPRDRADVLSPPRKKPRPGIAIRLLCLPAALRFPS